MGMEIRDRMGRYDFSTLDLICKCGHALGVHTAVRPRECLNGDAFAPGATGESCQCRKFRHARTVPAGEVG